MGPVDTHISSSMKSFASISVLLAAASAAPQLLSSRRFLGGGAGVVGGLGHGGLGHAVVGGLGHAVSHGVGYTDLGEPSPYSFQYGVSDEYSGAQFGQEETEDGGGNRRGSYSVNLPDGRIQHVNYHTNDLDGYVAEVLYDGTAAYPDVVGGVTRGIATPLVHSVAHPVAHAVATPLVGTIGSGGLIGRRGAFIGGRGGFIGGHGDLIGGHGTFIGGHGGLIGGRGGLIGGRGGLIGGHGALIGGRRVIG